MFFSVINNVFFIIFLYRGRCLGFSVIMKDRAGVARYEMPDRDVLYELEEGCPIPFP